MLEQFLDTPSHLTASLEHPSGAPEGAASFHEAPRTEPSNREGSVGEAEPFRTPEGALFATVPVGSHSETFGVRSRSMKGWLRRRHWAATGEPMRPADVADAIESLAAHAEFGAVVSPVNLRVARDADALYLDLADGDRQVVKITADGWIVVADPPVRFRRPAGMSALPVPVRGGSIELLRPFVNVADEDAWTLLVGALVAALSPIGPYFVLILEGEQDSAKSTTARIFRLLVDPNTSPLRAEPRDQRDLLVAATHAWVVALDNVSQVSDRLSDALCRLSTGGGFSTRRLYTDGEEAVLDAQRPAILTGITALANRGDLLDQAIILELPPIREAERRAEADFWAAFEKVRPMILGALCDALAGALGRIDQVIVENLPRMGDPTRWVTAAERALGWADGSFAAAYARNRREGLAVTRDESPISAPLLALADAGPWSGTATELLARLGGFAPASVRADADWPATPRKLTAELKRLAPALRDAGIDWYRPRRTGTARLHTITRTGSASTATGPLDRTDSRTATLDGAAGVDDGPSSRGVEPSPAIPGDCRS